jgi:hypothetical protein
MSKSSFVKSTTFVNCYSSAAAVLLANASDNSEFVSCRPSVGCVSTSKCHYFMSRVGGRISVSGVVGNSVPYYDGDLTLALAGRWRVVCGGEVDRI